MTLFRRFYLIGYIGTSGKLLYYQKDDYILPFDEQVDAFGTKIKHALKFASKKEAERFANRQLSDWHSYDKVEIVHCPGKVKLENRFYDHKGPSYKYIDYKHTPLAQLD